MAPIDSVRAYMELIREVARQKGTFALRRIIAKHGMDEHLSTSFAQVGWTKNTRGKGSEWISSRPVSEEDLLVMAKALKAQRRTMYGGWKNVTKKPKVAPKLNTEFKWTFKEPQPEPAVVVKPPPPPVPVPAPRVGLIRKFIAWIY